MNSMPPPAKPPSDWSTDTLEVERRGDVLEVVLNRPDAYNSIDPDLRNSLVAVFDGAEDAGVRAILLRGNGRGFCSGADLRAARAEGVRITVETCRGVIDGSVKAVVGLGGNFLRAVPEVVWALIQ